MPESGSQYVSLDDSSSPGWFYTIMSHPRERRMFIAITVLIPICLACLIAAIYYANAECPIKPDIISTTTITPASTLKSTSTSVKPSTSTTDKHLSSTSEPFTSEIPSSEPQSTTQYTVQTTTESQSSTQYPETTTHKKRKTTTVKSTTEVEPTEPTSTQYPKSTTHKKHKTTTSTSTTEAEPTELSSTQYPESTTHKKHKTTTLTSTTDAENTESTSTSTQQLQSTTHKTHKNTALKTTQDVDTNSFEEHNINSDTADSVEADKTYYRLSTNDLWENELITKPDRLPGIKKNFTRSSKRENADREQENMFY